tara:strand:- start:205 stop:402 length:198 start_codon:yes stop_codon:yes gene_type:complete
MEEYMLYKMEKEMKLDKKETRAMFKDIRKDYSRKDRQTRDSWILYTIGLVGLCGIILGLAIGKLF